ncbi:hypothetical protein, partial [Paenibacillus polymyxa]|uniref:hypothetical protein n=1 Tax=Paenibacillus polymyxa TaxID=1406 RepID=UPI001E3C4506
ARSSYILILKKCSVEKQALMSFLFLQLNPQTIVIFGLWLTGEGDEVEHVTWYVSGLPTGENDSSVV